MVFYHYDFDDGTARLNVRGRDKLLKVAELIPATFYPVVIERTPAEPGLAEQRRSMLVAELAQGRIPIPQERVLIGPPIAAGMTGVEAIFVYGSQLGSLGSGAAGGPGGYAGTAGLSGGGLSGGAVGSGFGAGAGFAR
jgi:hypothetical protein